MRKTHAAVGLVCLAALGFYFLRGGAPQVSHDNRRLIESVLTAVSARNADWLSANKKLVEERKAAGGMSDDEYREFRSILDLGESGRWDEASARVYTLRDAQRVTSEDLERLEARAVEPAPSRKSGKPRT